MTEQPAPVATDAIPTWELVIRDVENRMGPTAVASLVITDARARDDLGLRRYGVRLQAGNGRDSIRDAYDEAMDLAVYLKNAMIEVAGADEYDRQLAIALESQYGSALRMCIGLREWLLRRRGT